MPFSFAASGPGFTSEAEGYPMSCNLPGEMVFVAAFTDDNGQDNFMMAECSEDDLHTDVYECPAPSDPSTPLEDVNWPELFADERTKKKTLEHDDTMTILLERATGTAQIVLQHCTYLSLN